MRKYVVPIVALAGIALLSPHANAANMILKSRAVPPGKTGSIPVSVTSVSANQLWGVDLAVKFSDPAVTAGTFASTGAAFEPSAAGATGTSPTDVVVSGTSFVGGGTNPDLYWGYVRGTAGMATADSGGIPSNSIGLMKVQVAASAPAATVYNLAANSYNVKNDGTGNDVQRAAATGATSTATAGAAVASEPITVLDVFPGYPAPGAGQTDFRVPLHEIVATVPGDVTGDGTLDPGDSALLGRAMASIPTALTRVNAAFLIAGDISPANGYVPGSSSGANAQGSGAFGGSYGDGIVGPGDAALIGRYFANIQSAIAQFPTPES